VSLVLYPTASSLLIGRAAGIGRSTAWWPRAATMSGHAAMRHWWHWSPSYFWLLGRTGRPKPWAESRPNAVRIYFSFSEFHFFKFPENGINFKICRK
jgi:hypothetical protein